MKSKIAVFIGIILCLSSCGKDYVYRIDGKLTNLENQIVYAVFENEDYRQVDTIECTKSGQFKILQQTEGFNSVTIYFENRSRWITAYLKSGDKISISGDARYPLLLQVKGGRINDQLTDVRKRLSPLLKEYTDLTNQLNNGSNNSSEETDMVARLSNINIQLQEEVINHIKEFPDEEASVVLIEMFFAEPDDTRRMDELLALLDPQLKEFYLARDLEQFSIRAKRTELGAEAPDFLLKNIYGDQVSLNYFPDKYLLLAFTAPWCDMCQTEDLFLDQVVTKYPQDKVDVLLVSLDSNPEEVRTFLKEDSISWNLVTDSAGQATMMIDLYNVSAIPRCFLIDEEGKILLKTDNGIEIKQTLEKLLEEEEEEENEE
ncbi:TlpA disulfide reductase family protein [Parabacteroides sp. PFB2-10]|uniref:TlpA disulfide reductase family protein n=1 Tax=Parabacteroides sp. PFB2-10 TaxID=1742405 RepID=UPI0024752E7A|nr:TlpA disulfide reductase family protein [Parabacteroides sp. PFB2-10]MDL2244882.1 AhpC/TSA family protein [Parabacteroides sp. OttesenSCG-928-J18]